MTTVKYLQQILTMQHRIKAKSDEIQRVRQLAVNISVKNEPDRVQTSGSKEKMADAVALLVDLEEELNSFVTIMVNRRKAIVDEIESLDNQTESTILYLKYVNNKSFEEISTIIDYSRAQTFRIYKKAIRNFEQKNGEKYLKW